MFTGIVEDLAEITSIKQKGTTIKFTFHCQFTNELQIDQSVAHDGVCLTIVEINNDTYTVDVIQETIQKTNLGSWEVGRKVNVERAVTMNTRLDGHLVQGHVDTTFLCNNIEDVNGSWRFSFHYPKQFASLLIPKGSICINGTSLTIAELTKETFTVAIIPYTYENTVFHQIKVGDSVNIEFDMVGKYLNRIAEVHRN